MTMAHETALELGTSGDQLQLVDRIYDLVSARHERFHVDARPETDGRGDDQREVRLPAVIKPCGRFGRAVIHHISCAGMQLTSSIEVEAGELVLIKIGRWGTAQFSFPCRVSRALITERAVHLELVFNGPPLRVRCVTG